MASLAPTLPVLLQLLVACAIHHIGALDSAFLRDMLWLARPRLSVTEQGSVRFRSHGRARPGGVLSHGLSLLKQLTCRALLRGDGHPSPA
ncbi:hypothetical protein BC940DRAFT_311094 [Gongronella butleri]|nr:hypothetical protein BC940DRAFT_311094 [Gongronella butleri]